MAEPGQQARRFLARTLVVLVALGFVVNVLVAWACAAFVRLDTITPQVAEEAQATQQPLGERWIVRLWARRGALAVLSQRFVGNGSASKTKPSDLLPHWTDFGSPLPEWQSKEAPYESRRADARGWPFLGLWYETDKALSMQSSVRGGIRVSGRVLPLRPIWRGSFANSVLFGLALFLPCSPFALRRFLRLWQYRCAKCGYPIGVSACCTECGNDLACQRHGA